MGSSLKEIALVLFMQVLSLVLEYIDTKTLSPTVKKRIAVELVIASIYISGMTWAKGMISHELLALIGTVYIGIVCTSIFKFLNYKKDHAVDLTDDE